MQVGAAGERSRAGGSAAAAGGAGRKAGPQEEEERKERVVGVDQMRFSLVFASLGKHMALWQWEGLKETEGGR